MKILNALILSLLIFCSLKSEAQNPFPIPQVVIGGLSQFRGNFVSAFYAVGSVSGLALTADHLKLSEVYVKISNIPIVSDTIQLPAQLITWQGWSKPNVMLLVIHRQPDFTWLNSDLEGAQPDYNQGIIMTSNNNYLAVTTLATRLLKQNNTGIILKYNFNYQQPLADFTGPINLR